MTDDDPAGAALDHVVKRQNVQAAVLLDDLAHHTPTVIGQADVAFVQRAAQLGMLRRHRRPELLLPLVLTPVTSRH